MAGKQPRVRASHAKWMTEIPAGALTFYAFIGGDAQLAELLSAAQDPSRRNQAASVFDAFKRDVKGRLRDLHANDPDALIELVAGTGAYLPPKGTADAALREAMSFVDAVVDSPIAAVAASQYTKSELNQSMSKVAAGGNVVERVDSVQLGKLKLQVKAAPISKAGEFSRGYSTGKRDISVTKTGAAAGIAGLAVAPRGGGRYPGVGIALGKMSGLVRRLQASGGDPALLGETHSLLQSMTSSVSKAQELSRMNLPRDVRGELGKALALMETSTRGGATPSTEQLGELAAILSGAKASLTQHRILDKRTRHIAGLPRDIALLEQKIQMQREVGADTRKAESHLAAAQAAHNQGDYYAAGQSVQLGHAELPVTLQGMQKQDSVARLLARRKHAAPALERKIRAELLTYQDRHGGSADQSVVDNYQGLLRDLSTGGSQAVHDVKARFADIQKQVGTVEKVIDTASKRDTLHRKEAKLRAQAQDLGQNAPPAVIQVLDAALGELQYGSVDTAERLLAEAADTIKTARGTATRQRADRRAAFKAAFSPVQLRTRAQNMLAEYRAVFRGAADPTVVTRFEDVIQMLQGPGAIDAMPAARHVLSGLKSNLTSEEAAERQQQTRAGLVGKIQAARRKAGRAAPVDQARLGVILDNAEQAVRDSHINTAKSMVQAATDEVDAAVRDAQGRQQQRGQLRKRSQLVQRAQKAFASARQVFGSAVMTHGTPLGLDHTQIQDLEDRFNAAPSTEAKQEVLDELNSRVAEVRRRDRAADDISSYAVSAAGNRQASSRMSKDITQARRRLKVLRQVDPAAAQGYEAAIGQMSDVAGRFGAARTDATRKELKAEYAAASSAAQAAIAQHQEAIDEYLAEQSKMNRLGKLLAVGKATAAVTGTTAAFLGGPESAATHMLQGLGQMGGALQTYGTGRLVNKGFGDVGGWAAFAGGALAGGAAQAMSALYSRGADVLAQGKSLGDTMRPIHSGLVGMFGDPRPHYNEDAWQVKQYVNNITPRRIRDYELQAQKLRASGRPDVASALETSLRTNVDPELLSRRMSDWSSPHYTRPLPRAKASNVSETSRKQTLLDIDQEFLGKVGLTSILQVLGQSRIGRITGRGGGGLFADQATPMETALKLLGIQRARPSDPVAQQYFEAGRVADFALSRGRSPTVIGGVAAYHARAHPNRRAAGLRELIDVTNSQNLGFVGQNRDAALSELLQSLEGSLPGGFRGDLSNDARMVGALARQGSIDPATGVNFLRRGIESAARSAGKYTRGFSNFIEFAGDILAYEGTSGDPLEVERKRQSLTERDKVRAAALMDPYVTTMALTAGGTSTEEAKELVARSLRATEEDLRDEETSWFQESMDRLKTEFPAEYTAALQERSTTDVEVMAAAARKMDDAAASFNKSVGRFAASIISIF